MPNKTNLCQNMKKQFKILFGRICTEHKNRALETKRMPRRDCMDSVPALLTGWFSFLSFLPFLFFLPSLSLFLLSFFISCLTFLEQPGSPFSLSCCISNWLIHLTKEILPQEFSLLQNSVKEVEYLAKPSSLLT